MASDEEKGRGIVKVNIIKEIELKILIDIGNNRKVDK